MATYQHKPDLLSQQIRAFKAARSSSTLAAYLTPELSQSAYCQVSEDGVSPLKEISTASKAAYYRANLVDTARYGQETRSLACEFC